MKSADRSHRCVLLTSRQAEASAVAELLADHGIGVELERIGSGIEPPVDAVSVSVEEASLEAAIALMTEVDAIGGLRRIESTGESGQLLIPVDFSPYSDLACKVGFEFASRLNLKPVVLHVFMAPLFVPGMALNPDGTTDSEVLVEEIGDVRASRKMRTAAAERLRKFASQLSEKCQRGELPDLHFQTRLEEGTPEDAILEWSRRNAPDLVVMATRGHTKKKEQQVGSVAAEVLDSCRVPVFTVPENYDFPGVRQIEHLVFFCNLDHQDVESMESFVRLFDFPQVAVTLVPVADRTEADSADRIAKLCEHFAETYPTITFTTAVFGRASFREEATAYFSAQHTQLLVVPNKKINIFRRLFNPGIAHKVLFEQDVPMLALPV